MPDQSKASGHPRAVYPWPMRAGSLLLTLCPLITAAVEPQDYAVQLSAQVHTAPPGITLEWPEANLATAYKISRKLSNEEHWNPIASLPGDHTSFTDTAVVLGAAYEYEVAQSNADGVAAYGYVYSGIQVPFAASRGRVILVVDQTHAAELAAELTQLISDLTGDGWMVLRHDVPRTGTPSDVKNLILADYHADAVQTKAVFLFGHVPVPYSGAIGPDLHSNHFGAWPADVYYGEMEGTWTDQSVNVTSAEDPRNHNVPGDGKFDQSQIPGRVVLQVGRVDLSDLPAFAPDTEAALLRRYLQKNHHFRHKLLDVDRRALVRDNFGEIQGDAPAADAWRSFVPFFGRANVKAVGPDSFFPTLISESYLWSYAGGGGEYYQADGVGSTADFARYAPRCVFFMLHGSYFGDWDAPDDFLRAALASPGYGLAAAWTGLPHWFLHHMALGETIGFSTLVAQNNEGLYKNQINLSMGEVHIALMGDPTLRMHIVAPPLNLTATPQGTGTVSLTWNPSPEPVQGYYLYRSDTFSGPFSRLTRSFLTTASYVDAGAPAGRQVYMVRAVKLETSASGSYFNPSQGAFAVLDGGGGPVNLPPSISPIADLIISESASAQAIAFDLTDPDTPLEQLSVAASISDPALIPADHLIIDGGGSARTLLVAPVVGQTGTATITLTVNDGALSTNRSFSITVNASRKIQSILREKGGGILLEFEGPAGRSFAIESSKDLVTWSVISTNVAGPKETTSFTDGDANSGACRFYRVHWE